MIDGELELPKIDDGYAHFLNIIRINHTLCVDKCNAVLDRQT